MIARSDCDGSDSLRTVVATQPHTIHLCGARDPCELHIGVAIPVSLIHAHFSVCYAGLE